MDNNKQQTIYSENTLTEIFKYEVETGVSEFHVMIHATNPKISYEEQLNAIIDTYYRLREKELYGATAVFKRYFLSDASNQADTLLALTAESMYRRECFTMVCLKLSIILIAISGEVMRSIMLPIQNTRRACY